MSVVPRKEICAESIEAMRSPNQEKEGGSTPTSALDFVIEEVDLAIGQWLNQRWHSVLPIVQGLSWGTRKIAYVAMYNKLPYAVAMWTTPIAANRLINGFDALELRRFAIHDSAPKNTASRMLSVMYKLLRKKWPEVFRFISYQAVDHHSGTIYKASGWEICAFSDAETWHIGEKRADMQTKSAKVRWEKKVPLSERPKCTPPTARRVDIGRKIT